MSRVRIGGISMEAKPGEPKATADQRARRIAELLAEALTEGEPVWPRRRIVIDVPNEPSLSAERIADLVARELRRRLS